MPAWVVGKMGENSGCGVAHLFFNFFNSERTKENTTQESCASNIVTDAHPWTPWEYMFQHAPKQEYMWHFNASYLDKEFSSRRWLKSPAARKLDRKKMFHKVRLT